jgi:hypothetical protein
VSPWRAAALQRLEIDLVADQTGLANRLPDALTCRLALVSEASKKPSRVVAVFAEWGFRRVGKLQLLISLHRP